MSDDTDEASSGSSDAPNGATDDSNGGPNGAASVTLDLYDLSVEVDGAPDDNLEDVEASATELMDYLVKQHYDLEEGPDDRDRF